ncbi:MAG: glycerate kinase [Spirochaetia bacterium]|nr:glycerate kinase [Spirochaetia bacterium]
MIQKTKEDARAIFMKALDGVRPDLLVGRGIVLEGGSLLIHHAGGLKRIDLAGFRHLLVLGLGKASAEMSAALEKVLGDRIDGGFAVTTAKGAVICSRIRLVEASHPLPDARSLAAGSQALELAAQARDWEARGEPTLVLVLISGGGSSLLSLPAEGLSLEDKVETTRLLLGSGARIGEMNTVRKHLSAVKGGRLAEAFFPCTVLSLILSDVMGDDLDVIASGPTVPDHSSWEDAGAVLKARGLWDRLPPRVREIVSQGLAGKRPDTPKPDSPVFAKAESFILGNNYLALQEARKEAMARGYSCLLLTSRLEGEAKELAKVFAALAIDVDRHGIPLSRPCCILAGGESTVHLKGKGRGGRNQEMALSFLVTLENLKALDADPLFLSAGTDGIDGPTDAAGAFAFSSLIAKARSMGLEPEAYLADNDSYSFFDAVGEHIKTGPTGTNVCDLQILLLSDKEL